MFILTSISTVFDVPSEIVDSLLALQRKINEALSQEAPKGHRFLLRKGVMDEADQNVFFSEEPTTRLMDMALPVACIATMVWGS